MLHSLVSTLCMYAVCAVDFLEASMACSQYLGLHATVNKQCFEVKGLTRELTAMLPTSKPDLLLYCPLLTCPLPTVPISSWPYNSFLPSSLPLHPSFPLIISSPPLNSSQLLLFCTLHLYHSPMSPHEHSVT